MSAAKGTYKGALLVNILIFVIAIVASIVIGLKWKANIGVIALAAALICGSFFFGMKPNAVLACFPVNLFFYMLLGTFFYGFGMNNGTFQNIAQRILHAFGKYSRFMPIIMYITMAVVMALGAGSYAAPAFLSPIFFGIVIEMGMNPLIAALACYTACTAFNLLPWTSDFAQKTGILVATFGNEASQTIGLAAMGYDIVFLFIFFVVFCLVTGGFRKRDAKDFPPAEPLNREQRWTLIIILALALLLVVPMVIQLFAPNPVTKWMGTYVDFRVCAAVGIVVCHFAKIGDIGDVIKHSIPWGAVLLVCGTGTLVGMAQSIGIADAIGSFLGGALPPRLVEPLFMLICGALSLVVSGGVIQPMMTGLIPGIAAASGCDPMALAVCMMVGLQYAGFSPFSMGGTMATIGCTDDKMRNKMFLPMLAIAISFVVITAVVSWFGFFDFIFA